MKKADIAIGAYILTAFIMMIVSIPSQLLDVLLACNIAVHKLHQQKYDKYNSPDDQVVPTYVTSECGNHLPRISTQG